MPIKSYKDLEAYKKSCLLVKKIYALTKHLPKDEQYGLINQLKHSCISIPSYIAQGYMRSRKEYVNALKDAIASCNELETLLFLAKNLELSGKMDISAEHALLTEVIKLLFAYIKKLNNTGN